ncbi:MAG TPA: hypothetical protein VMU04_19470 [Candidatus Acidoferrum sp.]|nr:hypothetical protein [Candidatus Acidoferrum sp.]
MDLAGMGTSNIQHPVADPATLIGWWMLPRFMESPHDLRSCIGTMNLGRDRNIQHPTSNIQHPVADAATRIGCWMFDVGCWMFPRFMERVLVGFI